MKAFTWNDSLIGVKAFTYFPVNPKPEYESLYSKIMLFDRAHGERARPAVVAGEPRGERQHGVYRVQVERRNPRPEFPMLCCPLHAGNAKPPEPRCY